MTRESDRLVNFAALVLTACAIITTGLVVRRELFHQQPERSVPHQVSGWQELGLAGHRMGPAGAPVVIVVFEDFQCPFCALLNVRLAALRTRYPNEVAVVYRHFPLAIHPYAIAAARASECAARQGRFEEFDDALFSAQDLIGSVPWKYFATRSGVTDTSAFAACANDTTAVLALGRDTTVGKLLGVHATPTMLINGTEIQGTPPLDTLEAYTARALHGVT